MTRKKEEPDEKHGHKDYGHKDHAAHSHKPAQEDDAPSKKYVVSCQDGTELSLFLSKIDTGKYPPLDAVQRWFTSHGDKRDGKCAILGCAVCQVEVET